MNAYHRRSILTLAGNVSSKIQSTLTGKTRSYSILLQRDSTQRSFQCGCEKINPNSMKLFYITVFAIAVAVNNVDAKLRAHRMAKEIFQSRIIGGSEATQGEFPFFGKLFARADIQESLASPKLTRTIYNMLIFSTKLNGTVAAHPSSTSRSSSVPPIATS